MIPFIIDLRGIPTGGVTRAIAAVLALAAVVPIAATSAAASATAGPAPGFASTGAFAASAAGPATAGTTQAAPTLPALPAPLHAKNCLTSGDGYFRAHLGGAIDASIDWPNAGTRCEGESRDKPPGVRLSFQRTHPRAPNLLFVFGITGIRAGAPAHTMGVNLTVIVQGTSHIYGTLGDSRCTVDSLTQRPLDTKDSYRVEARGFCTQPAHSVRGKDAVLVSTFEFAGLVVYDASAGAAPSRAASAANAQK